MPKDEAPFPRTPPGDDETLTSVDAVATRFQARLQRNEAELTDFLPAEGQPNRRQVLVTLAAIELHHRILAGEPARVDDYLARFPELDPAASTCRPLLEAEFVARRQVGEPVEWRDVVGRFAVKIARGASSADGVGVTAAHDGRSPPELSPPELSQPELSPPELSPPELSQSRSGVSAASPVVAELPAGSELGEYEIVRTLGVGRYAQVYLARQCSLDRDVAIKISTLPGDEGRQLARLEHSNIVTVFDQQVIGRHQMLVMRFVDGRTLADWLIERGEEEPRAFGSDRLLAWLNRSHDRPPREVRFQGERFLQTVTALVLDVARALEHAHGQRVLHRDVKPANILLDRAGNALLTDFNVSSWQQGSQQPLQGGTPAYMAPEQLAAALPEDGLDDDVDERADLFALGVVFYELLSGRHPWAVDRATRRPPTLVTGRTVDWSQHAADLRQMLAARLQGPPELPASAQHVTPAVQAILRRCLAPRKEERYQTASELVEDLRRMLEYRPLRFADNISTGERVANFGRRHPVLRAVAGTVLAASLVAVCWVGWSDLGRLDRVDRLLVGIAGELDRDSQAAGVERDLITARGLLDQPSRLVPPGMLAVRRRAAEDKLASLTRKFTAVRMLRFQHELDQRRAGLAYPTPEVAPPDPLELYRVLQTHDWELLPSFRGLADAARRVVCEDVSEMLLLRADAVGGRQPGDDPLGARPSPLALLDRFPSVHAELPLLRRYRTALRSDGTRRPSLNDLAVAAQSEFERYLVGVLAAQRGRHDEAIKHFEASFATRPSNRLPRFWARFHHAFCCQQVERFDEAIAGYGVCIGMRPDFAWSYHNLGLLHTRRQDYDAAVGQFSRAVRLQPRLGAAHANLGVALFQQGDFRAALSALNQAVDLDHATAAVLTNRAAVREALGDVPGAYQDLGVALQQSPNFQPAILNLQRLKNAHPR